MYRGPQSKQSVAYEQLEYSEPEPPSSQTPSPTALQVFAHHMGGYAGGGGKDGGGLSGGREGGGAGGRQGGGGLGGGDGGGDAGAVADTPSRRDGRIHTTASSMPRPLGTYAPHTCCPAPTCLRAVAGLLSQAPS